MLKSAGYDVKETLLLADEQKLLEKELIRLSDQRQINLIFTTGGTGFSKRDRTPEATIAVCDRMANGIAEAIRNYSMTITLVPCSAVLFPESVTTLSLSIFRAVQRQ